MGQDNIVPRRINKVEGTANLLLKSGGPGAIETWGRAGLSSLEFTANKLLLGAGAGVDPTEVDLPGGAKIVRKTANQTVNNSAVLQNDNHLLFAIAANEVWLVDVYLLITSVSQDSDFKAGWSYPVGCTIKWGSEMNGTANYWTPVGTAAIPNAIRTEALTFTGGSGASTYASHYIAIVINGANAGNINFQWAQNTATVEDTIVLLNSCLIANKLT